MCNFVSALSKDFGDSVPGVEPEMFLNIEWFSVHKTFLELDYFPQTRDLSPSIYISEFVLFIFLAASIQAKAN